jgi:phage portal protein BeeE
MTSFVFRETLMGHLLLWGNAYAQIIRNGRGQVVAFYPLLPDRMEVGRTEKGELFYCYQKDGRDYLLRPDEVLHVLYRPALSGTPRTGLDPKRNGCYLLSTSPQAEAGR